ncbi:hypothetical protein [Sporosalibacterium faouarense]|uniref:hypothetical protein n=1 Tax=Sporosalibacterium faouarense TaxID=516123 RepID=UPI001A9C6D99|nr:hypothetical protein [Sporosalibacterium faouarense]
MKVYTSENDYRELLKIDITDNYVIGYNTHKNKIDVIPTNRIFEIGIYSVGNNKVFTKYDNNKTLKGQVNKNYLDSERIIESLDIYYNIRQKKTIKKEEVKELKSLLVYDFYEKRYNLMSDNILIKKWELSDNFNNYSTDKFIGYDMSLPIKTDDNYEVYVKEYWIDEDIYLKYAFSDDNSIWKISSIEKLNENFDFTSSQQ